MKDGNCRAIYKDREIVMRAGRPGRERKANVDSEYKESDVSLGECESLEQGSDVENVRIVRSVWCNRELGR